MLNSSTATTWPSFRRSVSPLTRVAARAGALACGLGLLQACSGADAVSSINAPGTTPAAAPAPSAAEARILSVGPDTLRAGGTLIIEGEHFAATAPVRVTVAGVELPVRARSTTRLELALPVGAFACAAASAQPVQVQVGAASQMVQRVFNPAHRVQLAVGESVSLLEAGQSRCVELAPGTDGAPARYVVAVVNTSTTPGSTASFELRGIGATPAPAGGESVDAFPSLTPRLTASVPPAARAALEDSRVADAAHGAQLHAQRTALRASPSAMASWQQARSKAALVQGAAASRRFAALGDTVTLMASASSCATGRSVRARVVYAGSKAVVLEDLAAPRAGTMDLQYRKIGGEFDSVVYPLLQQNIGDPLAMNGQLAGDGRVTMLFTRYVNDSLPGTAAFVNACNFYPRSTFAASNQDEVFYARVAGAYETPEEWRRAIRASVVHEAKHLASFAERMVRGHDFEEPWLEEATARIAEELYARTFPGGGSWKGNVGFATSVGCELTQCDDRPLIMWKHFSVLHQYLRGADTLSPLAPASAGDNTYYASGWSLVRWAVDRYAVSEGTTLRALVRGAGKTGISALASELGRAPAELMSSWATANAAASGSAQSPMADRAGPSWNLADQWRGLSSLFPGAFSASPLRAHAVATTGFQLPLGRIAPFAASFVTLDGSTGAARMVALVGSAAQHEAHLAVLRAR